MRVKDFYFDTQTYLDRRHDLSTALTSGKILLLGNNHDPRNYTDNTHPYRQDSRFLYYAGINRAGLALIIDVDAQKTILYGDDPDLDEVIWTGPQTSLHTLADRAGIDEVQPWSTLQLSSRDSVHHLQPYKHAHMRLLSSWGLSSHSLDLTRAIIAQRSIKTEEEMALMDAAVSASNAMHRRVMAAIREGMTEHALVAEAYKVAWEHGCQMAYQPIMTVDGQTLHNHHYHNVLKEGDMVLYDGGVEHPSGYCGDITRTTPVSRSFTSLQRALYEIVLKAYNEAVRLTRPGVTFKSIHLAAATQLVQGLKELGWMKGDVDEAVADGAHSLFFQCGLGHMIGLDVHDMENLGEQYVGYEAPGDKSTDFGLKSLRLGKALQEGYALTIEPGLYIIPELIDRCRSEGRHAQFVNYEEVEKHKDFGGIRVEDNFVITQNGNRRLGDELALTTSDVEAAKLRKAAT